MKIEKHILNANGALNPYLDDLNQMFSKWLPIITKQLPIDALDICVAKYPQGTNPKLGVGGVALNSNLLYIYMDTSNSNIKDSIHTHIPEALAHEMHHCARLAIYSDVKTLGENFVLEGLACQFESEICGEGKEPSFIPAEVLNTWRDYINQAAPLLDSDDYCFNTWFLGKAPDEMPKYLGYAMGYQIVGEYLKKNKTNAAKAYDKSAKEIISSVLQ
ncbi:MAG: DUF2268 domain-containing protein [Bdellovibrionales bacterium]|nr:DUF2268 domain-containing protein [Bdellovibrionales bacterium]